MVLIKKEGIPRRRKRRKKEKEKGPFNYTNQKEERRKSFINSFLRQLEKQYRRRKWAKINGKY